MKLSNRFHLEQTKNQRSHISVPPHGQCYLMVYITTIFGDECEGRGKGRRVGGEGGGRSGDEVECVVNHFYTYIA